MENFAVVEVDIQAGVFKAQYRRAVPLRRAHLRNRVIGRVSFRPVVIEQRRFLHMPEATGPEDQRFEKDGVCKPPCL